MNRKKIRTGLFLFSGLLGLTSCSMNFGKPHASSIKTPTQEIPQSSNTQESSKTTTPSKATASSTPVQSSSTSSALPSSSTNTSASTPSSSSNTSTKQTSSSTSTRPSSSSSGSNTSATSSSTSSALPSSSTTKATVPSSSSSSTTVTTPKTSSSSTKVTVPSSSSSSTTVPSSSSSSTTVTSPTASSSKDTTPTTSSSTNKTSSSTSTNTSGEQDTKEENGIEINTYVAGNETAYLTWTPHSSYPKANHYEVSYASKGSSNYTKIDSQLIREENGKIRADILGIKEGSYDIKVVTVGNIAINATVENLYVSSQDRSGYAHFNNSTGVGAYKNDGTLKTDAIVIYVTNATKNTVQAKIGSTTYTGLGNILKNASKSSTPIDIRVLDTIETTQFNTKTYTKSKATTKGIIDEMAASLGGNYQGYSASEIISNGWNSYSNDEAKGITTLNGLTSKVMYGTSGVHCSTKDTTSADYYSSAFDTYWNMMDVDSAKNVTIEGIGNDAGLFQWGFTIKNSNSIEFKNLTFSDYTEDAIGIQGGSNSNMNYSNFWIHNCTFNVGVNNWDFSDEQDKGDGDGATDFKYAHNLTISYCQYNHTHKTNLIGGANNHYQYNITLHHNYYNQCSSRLPLARQANMHFYNNYYYKCNTCQDIRANAFVLSESNYFDNCSYPSKVTTDSTYTGTVIKSYNDYKTGGSFVSTIVTDRAETLTGNCKPDGSTNYTNFDTSSTLFYYDSTNQCSDVQILTKNTDVKTFVPAHAGAGAGYYAILGEQKETPSTPTVTQYTVTFNYNSSTANTTAKVDENSTVAKPTNPTKDGYTFDGWYTNEACTTAFNFSTPITGNITLYAKWTENVTSNASYLTFNNLTTGTISESVTNGTVTVIKSAKTDSINDKKATIDGQSITKIVSLGGTGSKDGDCIKFTTTKKANITVYFASGTAGRYVNLFPDGDSSIKSTTATEADNTVVFETFENVSAGTHSIASAGSGLYIYLIKIEYSE